jgi:hypothetical protein
MRPGRGEASGRNASSTTTPSTHMTQDSPRSLLAPWQGTYTAQSGSPQSSILTKTGRNGVLCKFLVPYVTWKKINRIPPFSRSQSRVPPRFPTFHNCHPSFSKAIRLIQHVALVLEPFTYKVDPAGLQCTLMIQGLLVSCKRGARASSDFYQLRQQVRWTDNFRTLRQYCRS